MGSFTTKSRGCGTQRWPFGLQTALASTMDVINSTLNQLNMTSPEENGTQIEGHLMTQGWRIVWDTFFGVSMFLSILGNLTIIIMMSERRKERRS